MSTAKKRAQLDELHNELDTHTKQIIEVSNLYSMSVAPKIYEHYMSSIINKYENFAKDKFREISSYLEPEQFDKLYENSIFNLFKLAEINPSGKRLSEMASKIRDEPDYDVCKDNSVKEMQTSELIFEQLSILNAAAMENYIDPLGIVYARGIGLVSRDLFNGFESLNDDVNILFFNYIKSIELSENIKSIKALLEKGKNKKILEINLNKVNETTLTPKVIKAMNIELKKIQYESNPKFKKGGNNLNKSQISEEIKRRLKIKASPRTIQRYLFDK